MILKRTDEAISSSRRHNLVASADVLTEERERSLARNTGAIGIGGRNGSVRYHDITASNGTGAYLDGVMDEIAIYNTALTAAQIQARLPAISGLA